MGKTHKKAVLLIMLVAATLAGTAFALFPAWEQHRAEKEQEAMLSRLEMSMQERETALQAEETSFLQETGEAVAGTVVLTDTLSAVTKPEPERKLEAAAEMEKESILETAKEMEKISATMAAPVGEAAEIVAELAAQIPEKDMPKAGAEIGILSIPKIDVRLPVTAGVSEEQLKSSEGWVMQTAMIGSRGNAVIAGYRSYTYGKHFNRLEEVETGDEIFYTAADGEEMCFAVEEILTVLPDDPAVFDEPSEGIAQLTLYTCTPVKVATHRLLVRAVLVEE